MEKIKLFQLNKLFSKIIKVSFLVFLIFSFSCFYQLNKVKAEENISQEISNTSFESENQVISENSTGENQIGTNENGDNNIEEAIDNIENSQNENIENNEETIINENNEETQENDNLNNNSENESPEEEDINQNLENPIEDNNLLNESENENQQQNESNNEPTNNLEAEENRSEEESSSVIETGNANVALNVLNFSNTNFSLDQLITFILNNFSTLEGNIDLEEIFNSQINSFEIQFPDLTQIINNSSGTINNNLNLQAITGYNVIDTEGDKVILRTGNANVALNVLNFLNTNFHQVKVSFIIVNNFSDWFGDLVFSGENEWQNGFSSNFEQNNNNSQGEILNQININSETGTNEVNGGEDSTILTGETNTNLNLLNLVNTNLSSNWFLGIVNNFGNWFGNVYSLPSNFYYSQLGNLILISNFNNFISNQSNQTIKGSEGNISNNINIEASTGNNQVNSSENSSVIISTGDVNLAINLVNFVNSNLEGRNGILAFVNNYGNWVGDIAFGRPDLVLQRSISPNSNYWPGKEINFTLTLLNQGTAPATQVLVKEKIDPEKWVPLNLNGGVYNSQTGEITWDLNNLSISENKNISYTLQINPNLAIGKYELTNIAQASCFEEDSNPLNNINALTILADNTFLLKGFAGDDSYVENKKPNLEIIKRHLFKDEFSLGEKIDYQIIIKNLGNEKAKRITVYDTLLKGNELIMTNAWYVEEILPGEEIAINYSIVINTANVGDIFKNTAHAQYYDPLGYFYNTLDSFSEIKIVAPQNLPSKTLEDLRQEKINEINSTLEAVQKRAEKIYEEIIRLSKRNQSKGFLENSATPVFAVEKETINQQEINFFNNKNYNPLLASLINLPFNWWAFLLVLIILIFILIIQKRREKKNNNEKESI